MYNQTDSEAVLRYMLEDSWDEGGGCVGFLECYNATFSWNWKLGVYTENRTTTNQLLIHISMCVETYTVDTSLTCWCNDFTIDSYIWKLVISSISVWFLAKVVVFFFAITSLSLHYQLDLWVSPFLVSFVYDRFFFYPAIVVVTFCLHGHGVSFVSSFSVYKVSSFTSKQHPSP